MSAPPDPLSAAKAALRRRAIAARARYVAAHGVGDAGQLLIQHALARFIALKPRIVAGYWPIRGEIDPRPLMQALASATGATLALPVVVAHGQALLFRQWQDDRPLVPGRFGTMEPGEASRLLVPDLILVPLLAFDRWYRRLGYGGGFYDRTLVELRRAGRVTAVGIAYAAQELDPVPAGDHDETLDWILTEQFLISRQA